MKILFLIFAFGLEFLCLSHEIVDKSVASANSNRPFAVCLYGMFIRQWPLKPLNRLFDLENTDFFVHTSDRLLENEKEALSFHPYSYIVLRQPDPLERFRATQFFLVFYHERRLCVCIR
jgi:hypothetical protein